METTYHVLNPHLISAHPNKSMLRANTEVFLQQPKKNQKQTNKHRWVTVMCTQKYLLIFLILL